MIGWLFTWVMMDPSALVRDVLMAGMIVYGGGELPPNPDADGIASRFGDPGDKHLGGNLKCRPNERVSTTEHQCAHRYYSCGTILIVENPRTKKRSWCEVVDRGPYGANVFVREEGRLVPVRTDSGRKAWYVKKRRSHKPPARLCPSGSCVGRWRGVLDMSPAVSDAVGHNGLERIRVYRLRSVVRFREKIEKRLALLMALPYSLESHHASR